MASLLVPALLCLLVEHCSDGTEFGLKRFLCNRDTVLYLYDRDIVLNLGDPYCKTR